MVATTYHLLSACLQLCIASTAAYKSCKSWKVALLLLLLCGDVQKTWALILHLSHCLEKTFHFLPATRITVLTQVSTLFLLVQLPSPCSFLLTSMVCYLSYLFFNPWHSATVRRHFVPRKLNLAHLCHLLNLVFLAMNFSARTGHAMAAV